MTIARSHRRIRRAGTSRRTLAAALLASGTVVGALGVPGTAHAASPGKDGLIVFTSAPDGNTEIYSMGPDGSAQTNLTNDPARDESPAVSPDGTRIAFASGRSEGVIGGHMNIWVMNIDGGGLSLLTPGAVSDEGEAGIDPTWSPDGTKIAYSFAGDVWSMNADGSGKTDLTADPVLVAAGQQAAWSPDGSTIAYNRGFDIWTMNADGSGDTQLTSTTGGLGTEKSPDWSPDGTRIVYERSGQIWRMNADGSGQQPLAAGFADGVARGGTRPAWSPAGTKIVFSSSAFDAPNGPDIFTMNPDGTGVTRLDTAVPAGDLDPAWQPLATTAKLPTYSTLAVSAGATIKASGELFTAHPGRRMTVTLSKLVDGSFQDVSTKRPLLGSYGTYAASFADPGTKRCRIVARFAGDADHRASQRAKKFDC